MPLRNRATGHERVMVAEEVASVLRHDLRNKLAAVRQAATYLSRKVEKTEIWTTEARIPRFFALIEAELTAADSLVGDKTLVPSVAKRPERLDLPAWLDAALDAAELPSNVAVAREFVGPAAVEIDPRDLWLALECVLENAVESMPNGGVLTVAVTEAADRVTLRVVDQGPGMANTQPEAFKTDKVGHAGIGLRLARRAVGRAGGTFAIRSDTTGTRVEITLARAPGAPHA